MRSYEIYYDAESDLLFLQDICDRNWISRDRMKKLNCVYIGEL